jgi:riboflavin kinase/FMN adenylyltransferase
MKLLNLLSGDLCFDKCALGIGTFDGVHIGHQKLIEELIKVAKEKNLPSVILTFDHSPRKFLFAESFPGYLTTPEEKFSLLMATGVDYVVFRPFDDTFSQMGHHDFVKNIIIDQLNAEATLVGFNFGFGVNKSGNAEFLKSELEKAGRSCSILPPVKLDNVVVSSSFIRQAVTDGNFDISNRFLGRESCFSGEVVHGDHRGRQMGFPTANLVLEKSQKILPPNGVYACYADTPDGSFPALVNIGTRPTFDKDDLILEAHLLGFNGDLYHRTIRVRFFHRIRDERKFPNMAALVSQIETDKKEVNNLFKAK